MVFVKVRETYDLHTKKGKMGIIGIHTPKAEIIKRNYPGLLMQCKAYRPVSCDVKMAAAATLPLDPLGVGLTENDVAPEDVFNPILYKALSNFGMSQIDAKIASNVGTAIGAVSGDTAEYADGFNGVTDDFDIYYGILSQTHEWKHAHPQQGLVMKNLVPLVYEVYQNIGDNRPNETPSNDGQINFVDNDGNGDPKLSTINVQQFRGSAKRLPFINCTYPVAGTNVAVENYPTGFPQAPANRQIAIPTPLVYVAGILIPPSRLHELFFRMVVEWTIEFSMIRPIGDLSSIGGLAAIGMATHVMNYDYSNSKQVEQSVFSEDNSACMIDASEDMGIKKVM